MNPIYTVGGTVDSRLRVYVERRADSELLERCLNGEFTYILTSRQVGKSSLMLRTARKLQDEGCRAAILDLTRIGTDTVTEEKWYQGLLEEIGERLGLKTDPLNYWEQHEHLGHAHRFARFLEGVVLKELPNRITIFIDEIDVTLSLAFATDDFFAVVRQLYNGRGQNPELYRLSFVLIGVSTPNDLISDPNRTPFNIGNSLDLDDFTLEEAMPLAQGLSEDQDIATRALEQIFRWTGGHPYLTQKICNLFATHPNFSPSPEESIDKIVYNALLRPISRLNDSNLSFVSSHIRGSREMRSLLQIYRRIRSGTSVQHNPSLSTHTELKLSGIVVIDEEGNFQIRNRIYREVFTEAWIRRIEGEMVAPQTVVSPSPGSLREIDLPLRILVIGQFNPTCSEPISNRAVLRINHDNFTNVIKSLDVRLSFKVRNFLSDKDSLSELIVDLHVQHLQDFEPAIIVEQIPELRTLRERRERIVRLRNEIAENRFPVEVMGSLVWQNRPQPPRLTEGWETNRSQVTEPENEISTLLDSLQDLIKWSGGELDREQPFPHLVDAYIIEIDGRIRQQVNEILRHEAFRKLESAWRSLHFLVSRTPLTENNKIIIEILDVSKETLDTDLRPSHGDIFESNLHSRLHREYTVLGGSPYSLMVANYELDKSRCDIDFLSRLSEVAQTNHCPVITSVSANFFDLSSFDEVNRLQNYCMRAIAVRPEFVAFRDFRQTEAARFVGLSFPRILLRLPYDNNFLQDLANFWEESRGAYDPDFFVWGNCAFVFALAVTRLFIERGWQRMIESWREIYIDDYFYSFNRCDVEVSRSGIEAFISEVDASEWLAFGFVPLLSDRNRGTMSLYGLQSVYECRRFTQEEDNVSETLSANLMILMFTCRFLQLLKCTLRDRVGISVDFASIKAELRQYLANYITAADHVPKITLTKHPLRHGSIDIFENENAPGVLKMELMISPHAELIGTELTMRLVSDVSVL
jgi:type VI secretion system ImpC/EvpB family protein/type VI secretion system ImpB/VipA family protein